MRQHLLVTGASGGIGSETAQRAARQGYATTLLARESGRGEADNVAAQINADGGSAQVVTADVTREEDIVAAFQAATDKFGPPTAVLNSAGVSANALVRDLDYAMVSAIMSVNVIGLIMCCREATRHMSVQSGGHGGSILNVSSMAATIGGRPGASVYAASKGAVDVFTTGFAREVALEGIRVNSIRPGVIATKMTANLESDPAMKKSVEASIPMGRIGHPHEVAEAALWLLSPEASFVTGAHLNVGGGGFHVAASV